MPGHAAPGAVSLEPCPLSTYPCLPRSLLFPRESEALLISQPPSCATSPRPCTLLFLLPGTPFPALRSEGSTPPPPSPLQDAPPQELTWPFSGHICSPSLRSWLIHVAVTRGCTYPVGPNSLLVSGARRRETGPRGSGGGGREVQ